MTRITPTQTTAIPHAAPTPNPTGAAESAGKTEMLSQLHKLQQNYGGPSVLRPFSVQAKSNLKSDVTFICRPCFLYFTAAEIILDYGGVTLITRWH